MHGLPMADKAGLHSTRACPAQPPFVLQPSGSPLCLGRVYVMTPGRGGGALLIDRRERLLAIGALGAPVRGRDGPGAAAARAGLGAGAAAGPGAVAALPGCGRAARTPPRLQLALELALVRGPLLCAALAVGVARVEVCRGGAIGGMLRRRRRSACGPLRSTQSRVATS